MAYTKKIWVNVPNASELTEEELNALIPENEEGIKQDSLARFDADNMNRIEAGIEQALNSVSEHTHSKADVGLGNVDNTSDATKPVSTAQATAIADAKKAGTDAQSNLTSHLGDTTKHITATERNTWNGKANASHIHTKSQISDFSHVHDERYYTESEVNSLLNGKANSTHTHDDRYYTESEVNNLLAKKAPAYSYGTTDPGVGSSLETGKLYFVYEE